MAIMFNTILAQAGIEASQVILVRHQDNRADRGRTPFELWRDDREMFEAYQTHQNIDRRSQFERASKWASFVGTPDGRTLFVGLYNAHYRGILDRDRPKPHQAGIIDHAGSCDVYDLEPDASFADLDGKLYINWGDGA